MINNNNNNNNNSNNNNNITKKPASAVILVNKNKIYSTYPIFIFQTSFRKTLPPFSSLHH